MREHHRVGSTDLDYGRILPEMNNCLVKPHHAGLMSNVNKVVSCMRMYENVAIDWSEDCIYGNCWSDLFDYNPAPIEPFDVITEFPFYDLTAACAGILYHNEGWGWRERFHPLWKKLQLKSEYHFTLPATMIGVLVRCDNHAGEQLSKRSQPLDEYAKAIETVGKNDPSVFVMAGDLETIDWFKKRFRAWAVPHIKRNAKRSDPDRHLSVPQTVRDARECLNEVLLLSQCEYLVHPVSNLATAALYINPKLKSIYLP